MSRRSRRWRTEHDDDEHDEPEAPPPPPTPAPPAEDDPPIPAWMLDTLDESNPLMFIRLKKPTFILRDRVARALPREVLFNLARIGAASFGTTRLETTFVDERDKLEKIPAGEAVTIQIDVDGDLNELLEHSFVQRRTVLVFPKRYHGEYERIRRILEARIIES